MSVHTVMRQLAAARTELVLERAGTGASFESVNLPGQYLRHVNHLMYVRSAPDATARADATFHLE